MPVTIADVIPIKQLASHQYSVLLDDDWCIGTVPNGGYVTSTFLVAARTHMQLTHASRNQPHVINLHLEFFRRTSVGPALFTVKDVKLGARISNLHLTLAQKQDPESEDYTDEVQGYITMTNIPSESGISLDTEYKALPEPLPVSLPALAQGHDRNYALREKDPFSQFRRAILNLQIYLVRPDRKPRNFPKAMIDQWTRFTPFRHPGRDARWTNDALGVVVDIFPQIIESYVNPVIEEGVIGKELSANEIKDLLKGAEPTARFWYPTLSLNLDVKKTLPDEGVEWLFARIQAKRIIHGRFDLLIEVWDEENELVATSTHASLAVDSRRNTTRNQKGSKI